MLTFRLTLILWAGVYSISSHSFNSDEEDDSHAIAACFFMTIYCVIFILWVH